MADHRTLTMPEANVAGAVDSPGPTATVDQRSFEATYARTAGPVWAYLRRVLGNAEDADDVLQETYCRYVARPLVGAEPHETRAYLFTIASRLAIDHWRRGRRRPQTVEADVSRVAAPRTSDTDLDVARALARLKPRDRALLWLAYVEGSAHRSIAESVGVREKSVKVMLFRARRRLAALLGR